MLCRFLWFVSSLLLLPAATNAIQEVPLSPTWPIEERCVGESVQAPEDWTFEGTLLLTSPGKLHIYRQGWDTPRIQVFFDVNCGAVVSPDGKWFAVINGESRRVQVITVWETESIRVYSTETDEEFTIQWQNTYTAVHRIFGHGLYWLNSENLLYSQGDQDETWFVINPFLDSVSQWKGKFTPSNFADIISPDSSKLLYHEDWTDPYWKLYNGETEIELPILGDSSWSPDSDHFAAFVHQPDSWEVDQLVLFDLNGNIADILFDVPEDVSDTGILKNAWSPNGLNLLFAIDNQLYIADIQEKRIIDTCIMTSSYITAAWTPAESQFVLVEP